jgi:hypothetical protein
MVSAFLRRVLAREVKADERVEQIGMEVGLASKHLTLVLQREDKQELERFGTQPTE